MGHGPNRIIMVPAVAPVNPAGAVAIVLWIDAMGMEVGSEHPVLVNPVGEEVIVHKIHERLAVIMEVG